jgi:hypothetical protein
MKETKQQRRERLQRAGLWRRFVARRAELFEEGLEPKEAAQQALQEIEQSLPPALNNPAPDPPRPAAPVPEPPPCERCQRAGRPSCSKVWRTDWKMRGEAQRSHDLLYPSGWRRLCMICERTYYRRKCSWCAHLLPLPPPPEPLPELCCYCQPEEEPWCATCHANWRTVQRLEAAGFPEEAEKLRKLLDRGQTPEGLSAPAVQPGAVHAPARAREGGETAEPAPPRP